jgi:hypothetical protein
MDGFKLDVRQRGLDQERGFDRIVVQKFLQSAEAFEHLVRRRRNEQGVAGARATHPILRAAEFARLLLAAAALRQQDTVDFLQQAERQRKRFQPLQSVIHGGDVTRHLLHVVQGHAGEAFHFEQ